MDRFCVTSLPSKSIAGNDMNISLEENNINLIVSGNDCTIEIAKNNGILNITGNDHRATISSGKGYIKVSGNDISVKIGPDVPEENVTWSGNDIRIVKIGTRKANFSHLNMSQKEKAMESCFRTKMKVFPSAPVHEPEMNENKQLYSFFSSKEFKKNELFSQTKMIPTPSASKFENMESSCQMKMTPIPSAPAPDKDELGPTLSNIKREIHEQHEDKTGSLFMPD